MEDWKRLGKNQSLVRFSRKKDGRLIAGKEIFCWESSVGSGLVERSGRYRRQVQDFNLRWKGRKIRS